DANVKSSLSKACAWAWRSALARYCLPTLASCTILIPAHEAACAAARLKETDHVRARLSAAPHSIRNLQHDRVSHAGRELDISGHHRADDVGPGLGTDLGGHSPRFRYFSALGRTDQIDTRRHPHCHGPRPVH